ncbi:MAG TPA: hypothetical protein VJZ27_09225, partial [Aggregatilineales bacterium]|nr:hypothetical protein [Aggregatilineales bacterium]
MTPKPLYASYIIHLIARAAPVDNDIARLAQMDMILDALAEFPVLYGCVLADSVQPIEDYLSLRPERYDQIAFYAGQG